MTVKISENVKNPVRKTVRLTVDTLLTLTQTDRYPKAELSILKIGTLSTQSVIVVTYIKF